MVTGVVSCLRFYKILKSELVGHKPLSKLFAFKLMVGINFLMTVSHCSRFLRGSQATHTEGNTLCSQIIFWILDGVDPSPLTPNSRMNEADVTVGIPAIVNCLVMVPFSIFFHYAYDVGPYIIGHRQHHPAEGGHFSQGNYPQHYQGGFLGIRAFAGMMDPRELLGAIGFVFKMGPPKRHGGGGSVAVNGRHGERGHDGGYAHEMSRRGERRVDKHVPRTNGNGSYGYNGQEQRQDGRYHLQHGQYQGGHR